MKNLPRRTFLQRSTLAVGALPLLAGPWLNPARAAEAGPNSKIRVALIGSGSMGCGDLACLFGNADVDCPVICDIDDAMLAKGLEVCKKKDRKPPETVKDFRRVLDRKDVDAVLIATPDHWHALCAVMACQAGKDVYVEKPLALSIDEGRAMVEAARKHQRVVQMGSQWRSCKHILEAGEFVKSGKLGKITMARGWAWLDKHSNLGKPPEGVPPAGADYDMWLGPAPKRPFHPTRFHYNFRWYWDYAGGLMTDWGVHLINMLFMGLKQEWPKTVCSSGGKYIFDDDTETPDSQVALYEFPDYLLSWEHKRGQGVGINGRPWGVSWSGTEGTVVLNSDGWELLIEKKQASLDPQKNKSSGDPRAAHVRNFLDCMGTRKTPVMDVALAHQLTGIAHLGNVAYRSGHKITWDPVKEEVVGDPVADQYVGAKYRTPWKLPYRRRTQLDG
ncbi:MAG: Gfo/Idh/MocA family oxidoreductase [Verrucomicrobiota bacterium]